MSDQALLLLVDDDTVALQVLSKTLASFARIRFAKSGAEALRAIGKERPDLVLLDANMPGMSGREVLEAVRGEELPVIVVTSDADAALESQLLDLGARDFIRKPYQPQQLLDRIRVQLRQAQLRRELSDLVSAPLRAGARVLLVDDDLSAIDALRNALQPMGCELLTALDGLDALQQMDSLVPDLVLLDVEMPRLDGFAVCQAMQADPLLAQVPVAFVSVHSDGPTEARSFSMGAADFLSKPFKPDVLRARVRNLLRLRQERSEALQEAAAHWQQLGESRVADLVAVASDAVICLDAQGTVRLMNQAACALFGVPSERVLGQAAVATLPGWEALELLMGGAERANLRRRAGQSSHPVRLYCGGGQAHVVEPVVFRQGMGEQLLTTFVLRDAADRVSTEMRREAHRDAVVTAAAQLALLRALSPRDGRHGTDAAILAMLQGQLTLPACAPALKEIDLGMTLAGALHEHARSSTGWSAGLSQPHRPLIVLGDADRFTLGLTRLLGCLDDGDPRPGQVDMSLAMEELVVLSLDLNKRVLPADWRQRPEVMFALTELCAGGAVEQLPALPGRLAFQLLRPLVED